MSGKRFDQDLYDRYDRKAKDTLIEYLTKKGVTVIEEPQGKYGVDLEILGSEIDLYCDVEVRPVWSGGQFPFDTIHLPARKRKFVNLDKPTFFVAFREDLKQALIFYLSSGDVPNEVVPNKYVGRGEQFYSVPIERCKVVCLS